MTELPNQPNFADFTPQAIQSHLTTAILGRRIELHPQVGSTNDLVREAARRGEREGLVLLAEEQVTGRGRLGRTWSAPPGCCILCSLLLRPRFSAQQAFYLTIATSLAIYRAVGALVRSEQNSQPSVHSQSPDPATTAAVERNVPVLSIKWPNDVLLNGRKLSGVLSEGEFNGGEWAFSVAGFGINVNLAREQFGELQGTATSISAELGHEVGRANLLAGVLGELESLYFLLQSGQFGSVHASWIASLETLGRSVSVAEAGSMPGEAGAVIHGRAVRVDPDGALVVLTGEGIEQRVLAGDIQPPDKRAGKCSEPGYNTRL